MLAWEISRTEEPDGLQSIGSQRVGYDLVTQQQQEQIYHCIPIRMATTENTDHAKYPQGCRGT